MPNTVENFQKVRRKDLYLSIASAAKDVPETSRDTLIKALYLFNDDVNELSERVLHTILFAHTVNVFVIFAAIFTGSLLYISCAVIICVLAQYLNKFRLEVVEVLPAAKLLAESDDDGAPLSRTAFVFWY